MQPTRGDPQIFHSTDACTQQDGTVCRGGHIAASQNAGAPSQQDVTVCRRALTADCYMLQESPHSRLLHAAGELTQQDITVCREPSPHNVTV